MPLLYISYDGILEPLGQSQVVAYLRPIARVQSVTLLSYEKSWDVRGSPRLRVMAESLRAAGIRWIRLRYHKRPSFLATGWDVVAGIVVGYGLCRRDGIRLIHARGYVPSVIALCLKWLSGVKFLFDMRGFWVDERLEGGLWRRGSLISRLAKQWERRFFEEADAIVSLTRAGVDQFPVLGYAIPPTTPVEVIPTCVDLTRFSPGPKDPRLMDHLPLHHQTVIGCVGTLSHWYLRHQTLRYLALLVQRLERAAVLLVSQEDHELLRRDALAAGIPPAQLVITQCDFTEMPAHLRLMDLGVFLIQACFSKTASAATKLAEFLATGIPVVINQGIGDSDTIIRRYRAGLVLSAVTDQVMEESVGRVTELLRDPTRVARCRITAQEYFDLRVGVDKYLELYQRLCGKAPQDGNARGLDERASSSHEQVTSAPTEMPSLRVCA